ncbi:PREDICTED: ovomucoid-like [Nicrophorus vespilloides]|uniref:Ovomucoid-like n=1 Tax=Nicrophorus vespilloides TaxID=110193 RepID=A0ABM1MDA7_NICVS|nr:PREDICTED: ovomucoid-like [Nicrophorus vespilloides]
MKWSIIIFASLAAAVTAQYQHGICPLILSPICASNGITYDNDCLFDYAVSLDNTITSLFRGTCEPSSFDFIQCREYDVEILITVCGSDGFVYENECFFDLAVKRNPSLRKRHNSECPLICGSDGLLYDVQIFFREQDENEELYQKPISFCSV